MINSNIIRLCFLFLLFVLCGVAPASAQNNSEFCSNNNWSNGDKVSFNELREMKVSPSRLLTVDGRRNGGIRVFGENRSDILVRACIQAWDKTDAEARSLAKSVRVETGSTIRAEGANDQSNWSVSYEIRVPHSTNLKLTTHNGGISISSVEGDLEFGAQNGGIRLDEVAGNVRGRTTNGGIRIKLSGNRWKGSGLDVETTNGGVHLTIPENYAARIETGTVNGGLRSNINALKIERDGSRWNRASRINTDLNGGGATLRMITTNGGVNINSLR